MVSVDIKAKCFLILAKAFKLRDFTERLHVKSFPGFTVAGCHGIIHGVKGATSFGSPVVSVHHIGLLDFIAVLKGESWFP